MSIKDFRFEPGLGGYVGTFNIRDLWSKFVWAEPVSSYESDEVVLAIRFFGGESPEGEGITHRCQRFVSDNAPNITTALKFL